MRSPLPASLETMCLTHWAVSTFSFYSSPVWSLGERSQPARCDLWGCYCFDCGIFIRGFSSLWPFDRPASHLSLSPKDSWWAKLQGQQPLWGFVSISGWRRHLEKDEFFSKL